MGKKIAFFELEGWEEPLIKEAFPGEDLYLSRDKVTNLCLPDTHDFEVVSVFVDSRIDKPVFDCFPNMKCIATRSTGYDHIDQALAKERGTTLLYVPGYGDNTVAEFTFGLILCLARKIYESIDRMKETGSFSLEGLRGSDLLDRTLGVVGTGRIGREVIKIARGFGMRIIAYDPHPDEAFAREFGVAYKNMDELLAEADFVTLHCPYNEHTHHLLNAENIGKMKKTAYLVNTARGGIVETEALVQALTEKKIAGAALDVLEEEGETKDELTILALGHPKEKEMRTMLQNNILMRMPNVLVTPHNAFNSNEALERILRTTIENVKSYLGGSPQNIAP